jgi:hypothetical protein
MTKRQIAKILESLGPVAKGSLVEVRKPCTRPQCPACRDGRRHRAFMFHYADAGKRRCMYVPLALVGDLRKALAAGRLVEECLHEAGPALIRACREEAGRSA